MNKSLKGAFLSGLVFPGLGQIVLKHYKRGAVLMLAVSVSMVVIIIKAVHQSFAILDKIESEGGALDMSTISSTATWASTTSEGFIFKLLMFFIIFCWIFSVVDAYRIGRKKDIEDRLARQALLWKTVDQISKGST